MNHTVSLNLPHAYVLNGNPRKHIPRASTPQQGIMLTEEIIFGSLSHYVGTVLRFGFAFAAVQIVYGFVRHLARMMPDMFRSLWTNIGCLSPESR
jgi:hypothetical protein